MGLCVGPGGGLCVWTPTPRHGHLQRSPAPVARVASTAHSAHEKTWEGGSVGVRMAGHGALDGDNNHQDLTLPVVPCRTLVPSHTDPAALPSQTHAQKAHPGCPVSTPQVSTGSTPTTSVRSYNRGHATPHQHTSLCLHARREERKLGDWPDGNPTSNAAPPAVRSDTS